MRDATRRLQKLEERLTPDSCECKAGRPVWLRTMNEFGELQPDAEAEPAPVMCSVHGEVRAQQIVLVPLERIDRTLQ